MKHRTHQLLVDFIPIIIVFCFATLPKETILFSDTVLGKLIAISLIMYYSHLKWVYGFFVCAVILFYYQTDIVQNTLNGSWDELSFSQFEALETLNTEMLEMRKQLSTSSPTSPISIPSSPDVAHYAKYEPSLYAYEPAVPFNEQNEDILNGVDKKERLKAVFRKQYCDRKGNLTLRGEHVKPEMAERAFGGALISPQKCNPCDPTCDFNVVEEKMTVEEELVRPKHSNDGVIQKSSWGENLPNPFSQFMSQWNIMSIL